MPLSSRALDILITAKDLSLGLAGEEECTGLNTGQTGAVFEPEGFSKRGGKSAARSRSVLAGILTFWSMIFGDVG